MPAIRLEPGDTFAGYVIEQKLGSGGMGAVYKVRHPALKKSFALKILLESIDGEPAFAERFQREMETVSRLDHPNIVATVSGGDVDGRIWFAMNYVSGTDAQRAVDANPKGLPLGLVVHIVEKVCAALDYAHDKGVVHRDIKPGNILLGDEAGEQRVFLTDFGIAKAIDDLRPLTSTGLGPMTVDYASPEQIRGEDLDGRSDMYSLGATMFVLLTGRLPFPVPSIPGKMLKHLQEAAPVPSSLNPSLPAGIDEVIARAMAKDKELRYGRCRDLAVATRAAFAASPQRTDPLTPSTIVGVWSTVPQPMAPRVFDAHHPPVATPADNPQATARNRRRRLLLPAFLAVVLVLAISGIFLWTKIPPNDDGRSTSPSTPSSLRSTPAASAEAPESADAAPNSSLQVTPLSKLLTPAPATQPRTVNGQVATPAPAYQLEPKNCPLGSMQITVDTSQGYNRIEGMVGLSENAPPNTRTRFAITADTTVLNEAVLSGSEGARFDVNIQAGGSIFITLESLGQGACDSEDYLVYFTSSFAHP